MLYFISEDNGSTLVEETSLSAPILLNDVSFWKSVTLETTYEDILKVRGLLESGVCSIHGL